MTVKFFVTFYITPSISSLSLDSLLLNNNNKNNNDKNKYFFNINKMSSRDHPFNRSTRPLLAERKPQLLFKKKSDTKLHGFNDFDIITQQYRNLNTHHIGYPYGSPPSPTANSDDFVFSDNTITSTDLYTTSTPNRIYNSTVTTNNPIITNNCNNGIIDNCNSIINLHHDISSDNNLNNHINNHKNHSNSYNNKPLIIDEHNNWRIQQISSSSENDNNTSVGPFIFGIHTVKSYKENNSSTVINSTKYSADNGKPVVINQVSCIDVYRIL